MVNKFELSKTYQYRKVMKPLLERKRRARINKCLDNLKELIAESMQEQSGDPNLKLEKADILEMTVQHLRAIRTQKKPLIKYQSELNDQQCFRSGYIQAANEVSRWLASLPNVDITLGTRLMTHLGLRLNQLESSAEARTATNLSLSINTTQAPTYSNASSMLSPASSGYASDYSDCSCSSPGPIRDQVQTGSNIWRPW